MEISHKEDTLFGTGLAAINSMTICLWEWTGWGLNKGQDQWDLENGGQPSPCCGLEEALHLTPQWIRQTIPWPTTVWYNLLYSFCPPEHTHTSGTTPHMQAELNYYSPTDHTLLKATHTNPPTQHVTIQCIRIQCTKWVGSTPTIYLAWVTYHCLPLIQRNQIRDNKKNPQSVTFLFIAKCHTWAFWAHFSICKPSGNVRY